MSDNGIKIYKKISKRKSKKSQTQKLDKTLLNLKWIKKLKKTTVKNLVRIQSSLTPKYPEIIDPIKKSNSIIISSQNNNKTTLEEDKNNTHKKNKLIKKEPI